MKTILVPTDFSDAATNAAEYAVNLAKEINAKKNNSGLKDINC